MHHTFMHAHIPNPKFMVLAETSTFGIFRGRNVQAETSVAEMSVAEMSEHPLRRGQVLVFINRHSPTMNLMEEKQRGLIPPGLQSWPLQLIEHFSNTTSVAPPPAGPAGCRPLYLLHLLTRLAIDRSICILTRPVVITGFNRSLLVQWLIEKNMVIVKILSISYPYLLDSSFNIR